MVHFKLKCFCGLKIVATAALCHVVECHVANSASPAVSPAGASLKARDSSRAMKPARAGGSGGEDERLRGSYLKRLSPAGGKERLSWRGWERVSSCPSPGRESPVLQYAASGCASYCRRICKIRGLENVCKVVKLESQLLQASWCPSASRLRGLGF